jgi:membrane protease YdiL (CAAX protease family)
MHFFPDRVWVVAWSTIVSFLIIGFAGGIWGVLYVSNLRISPAIPWSVPVMAFLLLLMWLYLSGRWWPRSTSQTRRRYLRANWVSLQAFGWAMLAGALGILALAGYWIVAFNLVKMSANVLPDISSYPWLTLVPIAVMGSLVSPLSEEAAFRGYAQLRLEQVFPGSAAIMISSVLFALAHFTQGLFLPKLVVYYLAGVMFGVMAYLTNSILPGIATHIMADLTFFFLVWPYDTQRRLVWETGADIWFWVHVGQAIIFTVLTILAFRRLSSIIVYCD